MSGDGAVCLGELFNLAEPVQFGLEPDEGGDGIGGTGTQTALDGETLIDIDGDTCRGAQIFESQGDHLPGGISTVGGNAGVVGGEPDGGFGCGMGSYGDEIMQFDRLVNSGEGVEAVRAGSTYVQAEVDLGV